MKRIILVLFLTLVTVFRVHAQEHIQKVQMIDQKLYIIEESGIRYAVNTKVINVKPKIPIDIQKAQITPIYYGEFGYIDIEVPDDMDIRDYVNSLKESGEFEVVEYIGEAVCYSAANDSLANDQDYLDILHYDDVWDITTGSPNIKVGVIDTGIWRDHPDIGYGNGNYTNISYSLGYDYLAGMQYHTLSSADYHGTNVAGVIGAKRNNYIGIAGIAGGNNSSGVTLISYRVFESTPNNVSSSYVGDAIKKAVDEGAKVINISAGPSYLTKTEEAINYAYNHNVTIVCAAGNEGNASISYPASNAKTIAVGGSTNTGVAKPGLNYGVGLDIIAPAEMISTTDMNPLTNYYTSLFGFTSCSAAIVSGTVALMLSVNPFLTPSQVRNILRSTANKPSGYNYDGNGWNQYVGYGSLNAYAAVVGAMDLKIEGPQLIYTYGSYSIDNLPSGVTVSWSLSDNYYNTHNCLMSNYPSIGHCLITRDNSHDMMDATLTAKIKKDGVTVRTLTKAGICAYAGFKGSYTSGNLSGNINSSGTFNIKTNTVTTVTSPNFYGATVTYSSSGATPSSWGFNPSSGILNFNTLNTTVPIIINVHDGCGNNYTLYAFPSGSYSINVSNRDGDITVTLVEDGDASKDFTLDEPWTMEITSATTGQLMATRSSASRSETISTAGWPKGIYIVKVTIGKEELTEKVLVN